MSRGEAIADKHKRENGLAYKPSQIIVSCGGKHSCYNVILATCEEFVTLTAGDSDPAVSGRALAAIQQRRGRKHDPEVVAALVRALQREKPDDGGRA